MLVIKDLTKTYSSGVQALRGVSLGLPSGVFGLLGPNGSGKTTLMKIVATLLEPDSGTVEMNGADLITHKAHTRRMLGYLPQDFGLYPTLTAWQMLDYLAKLKGVTNKKERQTPGIRAQMSAINMWSATVLTSVPTVRRKLFSVVCSYCLFTPGFESIRWSRNQSLSQS